MLAGPWEVNEHTGMSEGHSTFRLTKASSYSRVWVEVCQTSFSIHTLLREGEQFIEVLRPALFGNDKTSDYM